MAAVAREPGAAAVPTVPPPDPRPPDPGPSASGLPLPLPEPPGPRQCALFTEKDDSCAERRHVTAAANVSSEANLSIDGSVSTEANSTTETNVGAELTHHTDSPRAELVELWLRDAEPDPVQSAVSPLSLPAAPEAPEAGLSLGQPNGPDRGCTERTMSGSPDRDRDTDPLGGQAQGLAQDRTEESGPQLMPGSQVRVSLDHVIDDALVVSFRVGHKVFSGVLMDLSRRFGPYGIPVTAFPPRRELSRRHFQAPPPAAVAPPPDPSATPDPAVTPLFHQGAPYPPPLFLRDSYHQSLPQPPPRRIKRSRRRYGNSEEPTCMLVRLRPRQVLCDRCKGVAGPRAPPVSTRRRANPELEENLSAEVKRLRTDEPRPRPRREVLKKEVGGAPSTGGGASASGGGAPRRPSSGLRPSTRVLTRRISSALAPPRVRLKPHRYRTDPDPVPGPGLVKTKTRPRPAPTRTEPAQRTTKNSTKDLRKAPRTRPGSRPGPGTRSERKDQNPRIKTEARSSSKSEIKNRTKTSPDQNQNTRLMSRPEFKPESRPQSKPELKPDPRPDPPLQRSRRKQVFPKPNRDYDLDFPDWTGPDTDLDLDWTDPDPSLNPQHPIQGQSLLCRTKSGSRTSETPPQQEPEHRPGLEPQSRLKPEPDLKPEPRLELETGEGPSLKVEVENPDCRKNECRTDFKVQSKSSPGPESSCSPLKSTFRLPECGSNPPDTFTPELKPESEPMDCAQGPTLSPDQVLPESRSKDSPAPDLAVRSRSSSKSSWSRSGSVVDSRPSSPASSSSSSSGSSRSRSSEHSRSSTKSGLKSVPKQDPSPALKTDSTPAPRPDCSHASRPDSSPASRVSQSRSVAKCVGADGRCVCVGDIVWAKIAGFPWWPARVLSLTVCRQGEGGVAVKQEVRVAWFGSRTTSLLPLSHTSSFLETFQLRFDRKRKGPYRRAISEAASAAKQLTPEVRALLTQFET